MRQKYAPLPRLAVLLVLLVLALSVVSAADSKNRLIVQRESGSGLKRRSEYSADEYDEEYDDDDDEEEDDDDDGSDCDNGNDDDDGSQWHISANDSSPPPKKPVNPDYKSKPQGMTLFPQWLTDLTGLKEWPGQNPPYIPMANINLDFLPVVPLRALGNCTGIDNSHCAFDCNRCTAPDDIVSCPLLSQTFDDGPGPATPKLLENLQTRTTFFTQGINVVRFPETFKLQHEKGHLLASHTWSHGNLAGLSNQEVAAQIQWSIWAMNATAGIVPRYFRPPYGASDNRVRGITRQFGLVNVFWDRDTFDWMVNDRQRTSGQVVEDVQLWKNQAPMGLLLEHDSTIDVVNVGIEIAKLLAADPQLTVAECVNQAWYQNQ